MMEILQQQQQQQQLQVVMVVQMVQLKIVQVTVTAVQNLGSVTVLKIVKTKHFGCDLTCYDNDGGDCGDGTTSTTTTTSGGGGCPAGTVDDCSDDGDCCPESWIGDGFDCEDQAIWL